MKNDVHSEIIEMVEKMPAFPKSVHRVMELTSDVNCNPRELVSVIEHDPILVLKILKLVNSASFGLSQKITSVNHALVYVGLNTIKNLAISAATIGTLPRRNKAGFDMDSYLLHSLATGTTARLLAKKARVPAMELFDYFLSGLLHDVGKIVFAHYMPEDFKDALYEAKDKGITLHEAEKEVVGYDHTEIGYVLGEKWQLPDSLTVALKQHHHPDDIAGANPSLTDYVFMANQISKFLKIGYGGESIVEAPTGKLIERFGMSLEECVSFLGELNAEIEKSIVFIKT